MDVFLTILLVIGIVLLSIIGLLLLLVSLVLFWPIKYVVRGKYQEKKYHLQIRVYWLLGFISNIFYIKNDNSGNQLKIAGIKVGGNKKNNFKKPSVKPSEKNFSNEAEFTPEQKNEGITLDTSQLESKKKQKKIKSDSVKKKSDFKEKFRLIKEKKEKIITLIKNDEFKEALRYIKKRIRILVPKLLPDRIEGYLNIGFEDPSLTGQILAVMAILMGLTGQYIEVEPDFENKVLKGNGIIKGKIFLFTVLWTAFRIYRNKSIRSAYRQIKEMQI